MKSQARGAPGTWRGERCYCRSMLGLHSPKVTCLVSFSPPRSISRVEVSPGPLSEINLVRLSKSVTGWPLYSRIVSFVCNPAASAAGARAT